jgi:glucose-1-phosphate thymidylyltransferase
MKALITAGGKGIRLRPITHTNNKHLIPIANKPMIHYAIEAVLEAGIKELGILINPDTGDEIKQALGNGEKWGVSISYIIQEAPIGLAHVVKVSEDFIKDEPFVFYLGDNVIVGGIKKFLEEFKNSGNNCHLVLARVKDPQRFGVPEIKEGKIIKVEEKPKSPRSDYAVTGIYFYDSHIFEAVNNIKPGWRGELEISDAHQYLIDKGYKVGHSEITGWWKDTGKPEDLLEANRLVLEQIINHKESTIQGKVDEHSEIIGKVIIEKGAKINKSSIFGPAIIGKNTVIENSYIGPFSSIAYDCEITNSELEYSIIMEECRIIDVEARIERSILGKNVEITKVNYRPKTQCFITGDQSSIKLI